MFYWSVVYLKHCVSFYCTSKWLTYTYIHTFFHILFHYSLSQGVDSTSLCCRRTLLFIQSVHNGLHLLIPNSHFSPPPNPLLLSNHRSVELQSSYSVSSINILSDIFLLKTEHYLYIYNIYIYIYTIYIYLRLFLDRHVCI